MKSFETNEIDLDHCYNRFLVNIRNMFNPDVCSRIPIIEEQQFSSNWYDILTDEFELTENELNYVNNDQFRKCLNGLFIKLHFNIKPYSIQRAFVRYEGKNGDKYKFNVTIMYVINENLRYDRL